MIREIEAWADGGPDHTPTSPSLLALHPQLEIRSGRTAAVCHCVLSEEVLDTCGFRKTTLSMPLLERRRCSGRIGTAQRLALPFCSDVRRGLAEQSYFVCAGQAVIVHLERQAPQPQIVSRWCPPRFNEIKPGATETIIRLKVDLALSSTPSLEMPSTFSAVQRRDMMDPSY